MPLRPGSADDLGDHFKVHYRRGDERFVEGCDTLQEAVARACRKLGKNPALRIWITDAANQMVLDEAEIRSRCEC